MKEQVKIPVSKVQRASKFVSTGVKVGGNYLKYYTKKALNQEVSKDNLDEQNASDIYDSLSELKGSALKAAQMLSMDQGFLPKAYANKFQMAQYSAPPLSYPLVVRTIQKYLGKRPLELFDTFSKKAVNAASIGQVHRATSGTKQLAVKIQYPGVADSVTNDLRLAKPLAARIMNVRSKDIEPYMKEVESKLLEETDYRLELQQSIELSRACGHIDDLVFPEYYPTWSSDRVLTMDWIEGIHIDDWIAMSPSQKERDRIGQALWNFYDHQMHVLNKVHADPHPGNFIITTDGQLAVIDFGCVKQIPGEFYSDYFQLVQDGLLEDEEKMVRLFEKLEFLHPSDSDDQRRLFTGLFKRMINLLGRPFRSTEFDFSDRTYFDQIYGMADEVIAKPDIWRGNGARGSRHGIYVNRTYFGLYNILHELKAKVSTGRVD